MQRADVLGAHSLFAGARPDFEQRLRAGRSRAAATCDCDGIAVRRERVLLDQDLRALARRAIEASRASGAGSPSACSSRRLRAAARRRGARAKARSARDRSATGAANRSDRRRRAAPSCPVLPATTLRDGLRLQPERMAAEVDLLACRRRASGCETRRAALASGSARSCCSANERSRETVHEACSGSRIGRLGAASATNGATCRFNRYCPSAIESSMKASSVTVASGRVACAAPVAARGQAPEDPMGRQLPHRRRDRSKAGRRRAR